MYCIVLYCNVPDIHLAECRMFLSIDPGPIFQPGSVNIMGTGSLRRGAERGCMMGPRPIARPRDYKYL